MYHLYVIKHNRREQLREFLQTEQIQTLVHYPIPVHKQKAYFNISSRDKLPITEVVCEKILSLPIHPWLNELEIQIISEKIKVFNNKMKKP